MTRPPLPPRISGPLCLTLVLSLALAACASLLTDAPRKLYRPMPPAAFSGAALPHVSAQLLVETPQAPGAIDTARIALSRSPLTLDYFYDAEWTDPAPRLVQSVLVGAFENSRAVSAVDRDSLTLRADFVLRSELRHFEAIYDSPAGSPAPSPSAASGPPRAWVELNVRLVKIPGPTIVAQRSFEQRAAASANEIQPIVAAFDAALGAVARDIVVWAVTNPALSAKR